MKGSRLLLALLAALLLFGGALSYRFMTRAEFVKAFRAALRRVNLLGFDPDKIAAVAAHESGFGSNRFTKEGYNVFGITAGKNWKGPTITSGAKDPSGAPYVFRKYGSLDEAIKDFINLLINWPSKYAAATSAARFGTIEQFAIALQRAGYGDPKDPDYAAKVVNNFNAFKKLEA